MSMSPNIASLFGESTVPQVQNLQRVREAPASTTWTFLRFLCATNEVLEDDGEEEEGIGGGGSEPSDAGRHPSLSCCKIDSLVQISETPAWASYFLGMADPLAQWPTVSRSDSLTTPNFASCWPAVTIRWRKLCGLNSTASSAE